MPGTIAFVLKGYPRLSETFIAQEIRALERRGLDLRLISLRHPTDPHRHPIHDEIAAPVSYLPEYLGDEPRRVAAAWWALRGTAGYRRARAVWRRDLARDRSRNRVRRFGQALVLAHELPAEVAWLHAHFLHTPASVTRYCALVRGLPWSCSAHAKDIWTTPTWEKREKLNDAVWTAACSALAADHLAALAPEARVECIYHGLDLARFRPAERAAEARDGRDVLAPARLLSVGRAVEKKGFDDLLGALARLPATLMWRLDHVGGGPLLPELKARGRELGLDARLHWHGPQPQDALLALYRRADLFVLASRIAADGDRDGIPNVLMEAQSQGLACLATAVAAIPELILDGLTGILVPPCEPEALAQAIAALIAEPARRKRLAEAALARLRRDFDMERGIDRLAELFGAGRPVAATA